MEVYNEVLTVYKAINPKCQRNTVLSSFLIKNKQTQHLTVCSLATGTKSLPYPLIKQHKDKLVNDLHAQILAQRGFIKFILKQNQIINDLFIIDTKRDKLKWNREKYELIFYSSEPPCGDCSIQFENSIYSGAKPLEYYSSMDIPDQKKYDKCILRTKPGRLDLPLDKRSLSLCCSDKMMLWNVLGVQGSRLFNRFKPIYIDRILIEKLPELKQETIMDGLSLQKRITKIQGYTSEQIINKLFKLKIANKYKYYTKQFTLHQPSYTFLQKQFNKQKLENNNTSIIFSLTEKIEQINGKTGLLQGASIKQIQKNIGISSYCNEKLLYTVKQDKEKYQYWAVKEQIKLLFGLWKDKYK